MAEPVTVFLTSNPLTVGRAYPANWNPPPFVKPPITKASCPADPVLSAPPGSPSGQPSLGPALEACLIPLLQAMAKQTAAINRLAASNEALVQGMAEGEGMDDDDAQSGAYLNGAIVR